MTATIDLNCDLGEGAGHDAELLSLVTTANVCCGAHAGDAETTLATLRLAAKHSVRCGAHPGFPDREHFGRRELDWPPDRIFAECVAQIGAAAALAEAAGLKLTHVKPHGGLYHRPLTDKPCAKAVVAAASHFRMPILALPATALEELALGACGFVAEGFADRRYLPSGLLVPRSQPNAMLDDPEEAAGQAVRLVDERGIRSLCVHGDNPQGVAFVKKLRDALHSRGYQIRAFDGFEVLEPGPCSLLVDAGRPHHRALGVSLGGAADRSSWMQGNALVGNLPDAVALEFALVGPTLRAKCDIACAISGAAFERSGKCFNLTAGDVLKIGPTSDRARGYLCVRGGFRGKEILGSQTSLEPIKRGDILKCDASVLGARIASKGHLNPPLLALRAHNAELRCVEGAQADWFDLAEFLNQSFTVTPASNRMGLRLSGKPLTRPDREMVSEPVCPGTVQVLNDGQCVILGVDAQTIGGFPKIAHIISADLDLVGQLRPGQYVHFKLMTIDAVEAARRG